MISGVNGDSARRPRLRGKIAGGTGSKIMWSLTRPKLRPSYLPFASLDFRCTWATDSGRFVRWLRSPIHRSKSNPSIRRCRPLPELLILPSLASWQIRAALTPARAAASVTEYSREGGWPADCNGSRRAGSTSVSRRQKSLAGSWSRTAPTSFPMVSFASCPAVGSGFSCLRWSAGRDSGGSHALSSASAFLPNLKIESFTYPQQSFSRIRARSFSTCPRSSARSKSSAVISGSCSRVAAYRSEQAYWPPMPRSKEIVSTKCRSRAACKARPRSRKTSSGGRPSDEVTDWKTDCRRARRLVMCQRLDWCLGTNAAGGETTPLRLAGLAAVRIVSITRSSRTTRTST